MEINTTTQRREYDEGLGTVYERFMLNHYFNSIIDSFQLQTILEVPLYGMTGLTGINSVQFAKRGCNVTLVESEKKRIDEAENLWNILSEKCEIYHHEKLYKLPFKSNSFDLVWNFAALWHLQNPASLIDEICRVSSNLVLIFLPNKTQIGYVLRKYVLDKDFFNNVDETWLDLKKIKSILKKNGYQKFEEGIIDIPPWPDTCMPIKDLLAKFGIQNNKSNPDLKENDWIWDIMSYYLGENKKLEQDVTKFSFLESSKLPKTLKQFWAHHRYILGIKK